MHVDPLVLYCDVYIQIGNIRHVYNFVLKDGGSREHLEKTLELLTDDKVCIATSLILCSYSFIVFQVTYAKQEKSKTMVPKNKHHRFIF